MNITKIIKLIVLNIDKYCLEDDEFKQDIQLKREYLLLEDQDIVSDELIERWVQFMPPLVTLKSRSVQSVSLAFKEKLLTNIKKLSPQQNTDIHILVSKEQHYAIEFLYKVQQIVDNQELLLVNTTNEPYLENACCISNHSTALEYFKEKDSSIEMIIEATREIGNILTDLTNLVKSPSILSLKDTRYPYPEIIDMYDETTIYLAVIYYCNYDNYKSVPSELLPFCFDKPIDFDFRKTLLQKIVPLQKMILKILLKIKLVMY